MNISAQEEYGIRCMLQLATKNESGTLSAVDIGKREGISVAYANKLLYILRRAGLVQSVRGAKGGFQLVRPPDEITLADIMQALQSLVFELDICSCFPGNRKVCVHYSKSCSIRAVWHVMMGEARSLLSKTTLKELSETTETGVAAKLRAKVAERAQRFRLPGQNTPSRSLRRSS